MRETYKSNDSYIWLSFIQWNFFTEYLAKFIHSSSNTQARGDTLQEKHESHICESRDLDPT